MNNPLAAIALAIVVATTPMSVAAAQELSETDLAALRYFLSINDQVSTQAEIERLETEFPGADVQGTLALIDAEASQVDTSPIWRLIETDEYAEARSLIAETREQNPTWTPPEEMMTVLDGREGQAKFEAAYAAQDLSGAIGALADFPVILTCDRINNPWRLAEMQVAAGLPGEALNTYEGVLNTCRSEDFVVATLQKANELADKERLAALFAVARSRNPALTPRLAVLETELTGAGEAPVAAAASAAGTATSSSRGTPARASAGGQQSAGGSRGSGGSGGASRARAAADRGDWATCLELTTNAQSVDAINQRAWCALNYGRPREAIAAFGRVTSSSRDSAMARDASYGMILAYAQLNQLDQAAAIASRTQLTGQQRQVVNRTVISKLAVQSFDAGRYRATLDYIDRLSRETGALDRGMSMLRGWALLRTGRRQAAREQFRRVHASSPGQDTVQGLVEAR